LKEFHSVIRIIVTQQQHPLMMTKHVYHMDHFPDEKIALVPDVYAMICGKYPDPSKDFPAAKQFFVKKLNESSSNKSNCCQYV